MDPTANRRETSATTLRRVEQNDPTLTTLEVSSIGFLKLGFSNHFGREGTGYYWPDDPADLARLGDAIGNNTRLRSLKIPAARNLADAAARNDAFFEGIRRNVSVRRLDVSHFDLSGGNELVVEWTSGDRRQFYRNLDASAEAGRRIVSGYVKDNTNLVAITLDRCASLGEGGAGTLASAATGCANVEEIGLTSCDVDDDALVEFASGIGALRRLRKLDLSGNRFWRTGCKALATLLKDSNLECLGLRDNDRLDDACAKILGTSLKRNDKLESMFFSGNNAITATGWAAFSQVLCKTNSVNETYLSNHTLCDFGNADLPTNLSALLNMNSKAKKKQVAVQKILLHHAHFDMTPFYLEWDLKVLPLAVSWFDRAHKYAQGDESYMNVKKLSAIYQFAKALPVMFAPPLKPAYKRTIGEIN